MKFLTEAVHRTWFLRVFLNFITYDIKLKLLRRNLAPTILFAMLIYSNIVSKMKRWHLTRSWRRPLSYKNQSIDLLCKSMDWFLYDNSLRHERVKDGYNRSTFMSLGTADLVTFIGEILNGKLHFFVQCIQRMSSLKNAPIPWNQRLGKLH